MFNVGSSAPVSFHVMISRPKVVDQLLSRNPVRSCQVSSGQWSLPDIPLQRTISVPFIIECLVAQLAKWQEYRAS